MRLRISHKFKIQKNIASMSLIRSQVKEMADFQNKCLRLALGVIPGQNENNRSALINVPMIKTGMYSTGG